MTTPSSPTRRPIPIALLVAGACAVVAAGLLTVVFFVYRATRVERTPAQQMADARATGDGAMPVLFDVPDFALPNQDGVLMTPQSLAGQVYIADFIFTRCTTACPILTARMVLLRQSLAGSGVGFVSFSVDPEYDTPAVLKAYAASWTAPASGDGASEISAQPPADEKPTSPALTSPALTLPPGGPIPPGGPASSDVLTSPDIPTSPNIHSNWNLLNTLDQATLKSIADGFHVFAQPSGDPDNPILHSARFFLVDGQGKVRGLYDSTDEESIKQLVTDARHLAEGPDEQVDSGLADSGLVGGGPGIPPETGPAGHGAVADGAVAGGAVADGSTAGGPGPGDRPGVGRTSGGSSVARADSNASHGSGRIDGSRLFMATGCNACHINPRIAPPLTGLSGRTVKLSDGTTVVADAAYLRQSITDPQAKLTAGYGPTMPVYKGHLSDAQTDAIVSYIQSLNPPDATANASIDANGSTPGTSGPTSTGITPPAAVADTAPRELMTDPVCHMAVSAGEDTPVSHFNGHNYYFCSDRCKERFDKNPDHYAKAGGQPDTGDGKSGAGK